VDRFTVKDEMGRDKYFVEGEFSFRKKLHVYDETGSECAFIKQKLFTFLPRYFLFIGGVQVAEIIKEFTFLKANYSIKGLDWESRGDFWDHDYEILEDGRLVANMHKEWMTWGDCYEMDIAEESDEITALAVMLVIDCVMAAQAAAASS